MLTQRQKQILEYIKKFIREKGYSPTLEEIGKHFRLSTKSGVYEHLEALEGKECISRSKNQARSIEILKTKKSDTLVRIPLLGTIAAGQPIEAMEQKEFIAVPKSKLPQNGDTYALRVIGNSMIDENIKDGDLVLVKQQSVAENGQKVVALIDNYEATLKKYFKERGHIRLQPANSKMEPIIVKNGRDISIQGVVIDVIHNENEIDLYLPQTDITERELKLPLNKIICGDAIEVLRRMPSNSIDLVVTSPPYDDIRAYNGFALNLPALGKELYRVLKDGGVAAMVIQDATHNFGKTLTSFRTILDWCDNAGFKLFETAIYRKYGAEGAWWNKRFRVDHEYIPIFLKGERPQYFNKEPLKIPSKWGGKTLTGGATRLTNGKTLKARPIKINALKCRGTVWEYLTAGDGSRLKHEHPATFPDQLPVDFIKCFCPPGGIVLDPLAGSGTTLTAARNLNHPYIGIDISKEYCELAKRRLKQEPRRLPL